MAEDKTEPPRASEGAGAQPEKSSAESGASQSAKPVAVSSPKAPPSKTAAKPEPWTDPLVTKLQKRFPGAIGETAIFRNMPAVNVSKDRLVEICKFLSGKEGGGYNFLTDETAVDYPNREKRFDVIYHLYSFEKNQRLRLRVQVSAGESVPSVTAVWAAANWLEREVYDMFGIVYDGHPDLKRILLPDEWVGHPLRKDYDILKQDENWVKANLGIESGQ